MSNVKVKKSPYFLRRSNRAKRLRVAVYCDGAVVVTAPVGLSDSLIKKFFLEKSRWVEGKLIFFRENKNKDIQKSTKKHFLKNKDEACILVEKRVKDFNKIYNFKFNKISIKNQKTRWGSCSRKGNLNFNYKILFLPKKIQDYIIVHELCHLKELNHSRKFWNLVRKEIPNYLDIRKELKKKGLFIS